MNELTDALDALLRTNAQLSDQVNAHKSALDMVIAENEQLKGQQIQSGTTPVIPSIHDLDDAERTDIAPDSASPGDVHSSSASFTEEETDSDNQSINDVVDAVDERVWASEWQDNHSSAIVEPIQNQLDIRVDTLFGGDLENEFDQERESEERYPTSESPNPPLSVSDAGFFDDDDELDLDFDEV